MSHLIIRFTVALIAFVVGVATATAWFRHRPSPSHKLSDTINGADSTDKKQAATGAVNPCQWNQQIERVLSQLYDEFLEVEKRPTIKGLVLLDGKLRRFFDGRPEFYPCQDEATFWEEKYAKLEVHPNSWGLLVYSGKLLVDAHRMDPKSKYRKYTLFSTIMGVRESHGLGEMPNIRAAYTYEQEFPDGPFIEETLSLIAKFNKDLYMVLRDDERDYKYGCFKPYINKSPRLTQMNQARRKAFSYYGKVLALNPANARAKERWEEVNNKTVNAWSFCAD